MAASRKPAYKRILLKLSGEALLGEKTFGIDRAFTDYLADEIKDVHALGVAGRARSWAAATSSAASPTRATGMDRVSADHMGMLATVINALALQDALERAGVITRVLSAIEMREVAEPFIRRRAIRHMEKGRVVDLRRRHRQPLLLHRHRGRPARHGDQGRGHPQGHQGRRHLRLRPAQEPEGQEVRPPHLPRGPAEGPKVMDTTAISLCMDNQPPDHRLRPASGRATCRRIVLGEKVGTLVKE